MAVLTQQEILKAIEAGEIEVDPFTPDMVGPGSIDLHLDNQFRVFKKLHHIYNVTDEADFTQITELVHVDESFVVLPGETVLGITRERIRLAPFLCGRLEGRSRFARLGLMVHVTAGFMQPGSTIDRCWKSATCLRLRWPFIPALDCASSSSSAPRVRPPTRADSPRSRWRDFKPPTPKRPG